MFDWLIVGAGFAGSVLAERLANTGDGQVLIIDRRFHIGGNASDRFDETGALVPHYGRHILQTEDETVLRYLRRFARWKRYEPRAAGEEFTGSQGPAGGGERLVPEQGYARLFEKMLNAPNIKIMLNVNYKEIQGVVAFRRLIYTGSMDEYFDYCYGKLPYWALDADRTAPHRASVRQFFPADVIAGRPEDEGGYPVGEESALDLYRRYQDLAEAAADVFFAGRLATYRYCTIDEVVAQSLDLFDRINGGSTAKLPATSPPGSRALAVQY